MAAPRSYVEANIGKGVTAGSPSAKEVFWLDISAVRRDRTTGGIVRRVFMTELGLVSAPSSTLDSELADQVIDR